MIFLNQGLERKIMEPGKLLAIFLLARILGFLLIILSAVFWFKKIREKYGVKNSDWILGYRRHLSESDEVILFFIKNEFSFLQDWIEENFLPGFNGKLPDWFLEKFRFLENE